MNSTHLPRPRSSWPSKLQRSGHGIGIRGARSLGLVISSLIFLTAIGAVTLLARAPFGEIYGTLLGETGSTRTASITLYGATKPKVEMSVAEKEGGAYVILSIEDVVPFDTPDGDTATITLTIPGSWHLEESRGVHASNIASYAASERTTLIIPMALLDSPRTGGTRSPLRQGYEGQAKRTVKLTFTTNEKFESVAFTHDASSPALFTLIHLTLPGGASEQKVQIVEESMTVELQE